LPIGNATANENPSAKGYSSCLFKFTHQPVNSRKFLESIKILKGIFNMKTIFDIRFYVILALIFVVMVNCDNILAQTLTVPITPVTPLQYDETDDFSEGLARVQLNGKWEYVDKKDNEIWNE
jgi:hypothetical protein